MSDQKTSERFRVHVADDQLSATLMGDGSAAITAAEVLARLKELKIQSVDTKAIDTAVATPVGTAISAVVARGNAAVEERPGRVNFKIPIADAQNGTVSRVEIGQLIGTTTKPIPGKDGQDIFGKVLPHKKNILPFQLASGLTLKKDEIVAEEAGNLRMKGEKLYIVPLLEVDGDDGALGPMISSDGDVAIKGSLREGRGVNTKGSLIIGGTVKSSILKVGGSAFTKGGLIGKNKSKCVIGDELRCAFITSAAVVAGGDVHVQTEIQGSRIFCSGQLHVTRGPIVGGDISANGGVVCQTIGNLMGVATVVGAGTDRVTKSLQAAANAESDAYKKRIADMRSKITPLMEKLKSLTPEQRERVTELMYEAEELETKNEEMLAELFKRSQLMQQRAKAEIQVAEMVYPGVKILLPGVEAMVTTTLQGPLRISVEQAESGPVIVVTQSGSGAAHVLPSAVAANQAGANKEGLLKAAA